MHLNKQSEQRQALDEENTFTEGIHHQDIFFNQKSVADVVEGMVLHIWLICWLIYFPTIA